MIQTVGVPKYLRVIIFSALIISSVRANDFTTAGIAFARGNFEQAEEAINKHLKENPDDEKAKKLYQQIVVKHNMKLAKESLEAGDDEAAGKYAEKAYDADPENTKVKDLYLATRKIKKVTVGKTEFEKKKIKLEKPEFAETPSFGQGQEEKVVTKTEYMTRTEYKTKKIVQQVAEIPDWIWLSVAFNILLLTGIYLLYNYRKKSNKAVYENYLRSKLMLSNALKYDAETVKKQLGEDRAAELFRLVSVEGMPEDISIKFVEAGRAFTDINPVPRLTADMIELAEQFLPNKKEIVEYIKPFLQHSNNRVQGNAVKIMFRHNPSLALKTLKGMTSSEDRWKKISAVWVCSQLNTRETQVFLKKLAEDGDIGVSMAAEKAIKELEEKDREALSEGKMGEKKENPLSISPL